MKRGYHVICYVDGEEGGNGERGWTQVQLHNTPLNVRKGMAVLSHWTGVPIRPVVLTTAGQKLTLRSRDDIYVNERPQYQATMQYCYNLLEDLSGEEILQWERIGELYDKTISARSETFNTSIWLPVYAKQKNMLLDIVEKTTLLTAASQPCILL